MGWVRLLVFVGKRELTTSPAVVVAASRQMNRHLWSMRMVVGYSSESLVKAICCLATCLVRKEGGVVRGMDFSGGRHVSDER
jgi:hypothetical protein